jgi:hypothetical protein
MKIVSQVNCNDAACGRRVDAHVIRGVVQELGSRVSLNVVGIVVTPSQLDVDPVLSGGGAIKLVVLLVQETWFGDLPLEVGEK